MPSAKKNRKNKVHVEPVKKKLWKIRKKQYKHINSGRVRESWDTKKSLQENLNEMGMDVDPNEVLPPPKLKPYAPTIIKEDFKESKKCISMKAMENDVKLPEKAKPDLRLSKDEVYFCQYMLDKHQDKYKAMARDKMNALRLTPKQIREKLRRFKRSKQSYNSYKDHRRKQDECLTLLQKMNTSITASSFNDDILMT